ncbi:MAG: hypothetical protein H0W31_11570, partial [Actinobacteria bacterium]|nr:hypothetical protein [Actinomycetota bacterium]
METRLERKLAAARKYRSVIRFFKNHRSLLGSSEHRAVANKALTRAERRLARVTKTIVALRGALQRRKARRLDNAPPKVAICRVFGSRFCDQALKVAWCESHHSTTAQNG